MPRKSIRKFVRKAKRIRRMRRRGKHRASNSATVSKMRKKGDHGTNQGIPSLIADRTFTVLKYTDSLPFVRAGGLTQGFSYRGNSIWDPDFTQVGHHPAGWDAYNRMYYRYRVYASRIKISLAGTANSSLQTSVVFGIVPYNQAQEYTANEYMSFPYSKWKTAQTIYKPETLSHYMHTDKIFGYPRGTTKFDHQNTALFNANPLKTWFWHVWMQTTDQSSTLGVHALVEIDYYVEMFDKYNLAGLVDTAYVGATGATGSFSDTETVIGGATGSEFH